MVARAREAVSPLPFSAPPAVDPLLVIDTDAAQVILQQLEARSNTESPVDCDAVPASAAPQNGAAIPTQTGTTSAGDGVEGNRVQRPKQARKKRRQAAVAAANQDKRVRKPTHTVRREEKEALLKEIIELERKLECLLCRAGQYSARIDETELNNVVLRDAVREHQLSMATAQSALLGYLHRDYISPLKRFIHLGTDCDERRQTLLAMKEQKIANAYEYIAARSKFLDPLKPHISDERFENAQGDYCCVWFDTIQFENVKSVKQVYDAIVFYLLSMEISITERLGNLTIRDDYDFVHDNTMSSYRLLSKESGVEVEVNGVMVAKYFENHELCDGNPCGIVAVDNVDVDKLHPYMPQKRVRKDICAGIVLTPHWRKRAITEGEEDNGADEDELVVTMSRSGLIKLHKPEFPIEPRVLQEMREKIDLWRHVLLKSIQDVLSFHF